MSGRDSGINEIQLRVVQVNGIKMRIAEQGDAAKPLVLLMHGWPESWMSWRSQLPALAHAGYHAVAPDMRGYGGTEAPQEVSSYDCEHIAKDMLALLDVLGKQCYALVGHDWGAILVWCLGLLRPKDFPRLCAMSVPPSFIASPTPPVSEGMSRVYRDNFFYILYHNEYNGQYGAAWPNDGNATTGPAELEYDEDPEATLRRLYLSGATGTSGLKSIELSKPLISDPKRSAGGLLGRFPVPKAGFSMPAWLPETTFQQYVAEFQRAGFRGGVNYYRNIDRNWRLTRSAWDAARGKIHQPCMFIAGQLDSVVLMSGGKKQIKQQLENICTDLRGCVYIPDCGHWNTQEKTAETNHALLDFLEKSRDISSQDELRSRL